MPTTWPTNILRSFAVLAVSLSAFATPRSDALATQANLEWNRQFGPADPHDSTEGISTDESGNIYAVGHTTGDFEGTAFGDFDAVLMKLSPAGDRLWARQWGTAAQEFGRGIAVDQQGVYVVGGTEGNSGMPSLGARDAVLRRYDFDGNLVWSEQFGTAAVDEAMGAYADGSGNVFVTGITGGNFGATNAGGSDAFLSKFNSSGDLLWTRQIGTNVDDSGLAVSGDAFGNIYIAGGTQGSLGGPKAGRTNNPPLPYDAYVARFDQDGNQFWIRQLGTEPDDTALGAATDGLGNVYIGGVTLGTIEPGMGNFTTGGFLTKYDLAGNRLWIRQQALGGGLVASTEVAADSQGQVYITGYTSIALTEETNAGERDGYLRQYDSDGNLNWTKQWGTNKDDFGHAVTADRLGNIYVGGSTFGDFPGHAGNAFRDITVTKLAIPEPASATLAMAGIGLVAGTCRVAPRRRCLVRLRVASGRENKTSLRHGRRRLESIPSNAERPQLYALVPQQTGVLLKQM